ncbi:MAG: RNA methyltransferase [Aeriscardovia sp.]|nr:RNA methyltransferase [Aeriscardovia sp.]
MKGEALREGSERASKLAFYASKAGWKKSGKFLVEGPQAVREALRSGLAEDVYFDESLNLPKEFCEGRGAWFHPSSPRALEKVSKDCQGVLACASSRKLERGFSSLDLSGTFVICALWQVRDPGNEGTVIRSCDAAGCRAVLLVDECASPFNPKVVRSSAGSIFHIPFFKCSEKELLSLKDRVFLVSTSGRDFDKKVLVDSSPSVLEGLGSMVLLFGNEARGLPDRLIKESHAVARIPIYGQAESLNLSSAASILVYDAVRSQRMKGEI